MTMQQDSDKPGDSNEHGNECQFEEIPADHDFSQAVGHDPRLMRAMGMALQVLRDNAHLMSGDSQKLIAKIDDATRGDISFNELLEDKAFQPRRRESDEPHIEPDADLLREVVQRHRDEMSSQDKEELQKFVDEHIRRLEESDLVQRARKASEI